jgi:hypothetical protein
MRCGRPSDRTLIFPGHDATVWTLGAYQSWRRRSFDPALRAGLGDASTADPLTLRCPKCKAAVGYACHTPSRAQAQPHASQVHRGDGHPYALLHSFASLLLHEGRSVIDVASQLGHDARLTLGTSGQVIEELGDGPRLTTEAAIEAARSTPVGHQLPIAAGDRG